MFFQDLRNSEMAEQNVEEDEESENLPAVEGMPCFGVQRSRQGAYPSEDKGQNSLQHAFRVEFATLDFPHDKGVVRAAAFAGTAAGTAFGIGDSHDAAAVCIGQPQDSAATCVDALSATAAKVGTEKDFGLFHFRWVSVHADDRAPKIF